MTVFNDFIGNERIREQLRYLLASGHLPHAVLLEGETGLGKRTLAREIALYLLCRGEGEKPCRECAQCRKVLKGVHPDVFEYTAEDRPKAFGIETVRDIKSNAFMQPNEADFRVFILGNCQSMSAEAQNAILKLIEEPPAYAVFLMTVTTKSAMLPTVLSRSTVFTLEGVSPENGAQWLCERHEGMAYDAALRMCRTYNGNIGKAEAALTDGNGDRISEAAGNIARAAASGSEYELLKACAVFGRDREMLQQTLSLLKIIVRDAMAHGSGDILSGNREAAEALAGRLSRDKLMKTYRALEELEQAVRRNANMPLLMTRMCTELLRAQNR